jgi:hypothetical protein
VLERHCNYSLANKAKNKRKAYAVAAFRVKGESEGVIQI